MKRIFTLILAVLLAFSLVLIMSGCRGEQGLPGEKGEQGIQGEQGAPGKDGAPGEKGDDGVSIIKTEVIDGYLWITYSNDPENPVNAGKVSDDGQDVQEGTDGLDYYPLPDGTYGVKAGNTLYLEHVEIPSTYKGKAVTQILDEAFKYGDNLKSITIPNSVTSIGNYAFSGCSAVASIEIPEGVTSIGDCAFSGCSAVANIEIPDSVTSIGDYAFEYCTSLEKIYYTGTEEEWELVEKGKAYIPDSCTIVLKYSGEEIYQAPELGNRVGKLCYDYELSYVNGDGTLKISDLRGKVVVINFWGTWCTPCIQELPHFDAVASEYADEVVVVTIHSTEGLPDAPSYIAQYYPDSAMLFTHDEVNPSNPMTDDYYTKLGGKGAYPMTLILDENGVITFKRMGSLTAVELENAVSAALGN